MKKRIFCLLFGFLLQVSLFAQTKVNPNLFGFRTSTAFVYFSAKDTSFLNRVKSLHPQVLSFPGGFGNFYHPDGDGYGIKEQEVALYHTGNKANVANTLNTIIAKGKVKQNYLQDFMLLAKETNAGVIYNLNVLTGNLNEYIAVIDSFKHNDIHLIGIELGGELSNTAYKHKVNEQFYITKSKEIVKSLKEIYPDLYVTVVAAPVASIKRHEKWNEALAKEHFYDAIVVHSYAKVIKGEDLDGQMISEVEEGKTKKESFNVYKNRIISYLNSDYPNKIKTYNRIFKNKPIWITEWNLQMSKTTANTVLQGLFVANYLLEIIASPDLQSIELATFHNLAGRTKSGCVFLKDEDKTQNMITYLPLKMVSQIFNENTLLLSKKMIDAACFQYQFVQQKSNRKWLCWVNWSEKPVDIKIPQISKAELFAFWGEELFTANEDKENIHYEKKATRQSSWQLKPYSFTIINYNDGNE